MAVLEPGTDFGRYRIERMLGSGAFGRVYVAEEQSGYLHRRVALKVSDSEQHPEESRRLLLHEITVADALTPHPNILPVHDAGEIDGRLYMSMPFVDGPELPVLLSKRAELRDEFIRGLITQIADALDVAHARGIVHHDLKPANLLLTRDLEHVFVIDFGASGDRTFIGTVEYAAPEWFAGDAGDHRSDVYSLGCILFELLVGAPPPVGSYDGSLRSYARTVPPRVSDHRATRRDFDDVVSKAMATRPGDRYQSAGALAQALAAVVESRRALHPTAFPLLPAVAAPSMPVQSPPPTTTAVDADWSAPPHAAPTSIPAPPPPQPGPTPSSLAPPPTFAPPAAMYAPGDEAANVVGLDDVDLDAAADPVECTVFAPKSARTGTSLFVQVFAHLLEQTDAVAQLAQEFDETASRRGVETLGLPVNEGDTLTFELVAPRLNVVDAVQSLVWRRRPRSVQFEVAIADDAPTGPVVLTLVVSKGSVPCGHVKFRCDVLREEASPDPGKTIEPEWSWSSFESAPTGASARRYRTSFISYASSDRVEVLKRLQMLRAVGIEYFQDIDLDPGQRWEAELYKHIDACDLFLLFWSSAAKSSEWVRREVQHALECSHGDPGARPEIRPVILEGPPIVPPWDELAGLQFNDRLLYVLNAEAHAEKRTTA